ncbi:hypothetical protein CX648_07570 [Aeromonas dhakensis]|nr:hypothetical protein CX648_07570 [Aeromonas dhakensis]
MSATLGRDLQELQRSHRKAIDLLHDRDIERVNRYIEQVVIPTYVKTVIDSVGPRLSQDLSKAIAANATQADKDKVYDEMRKTVLGISSRVEKQRQDLISPIEEARKARLQELDMAYAQMQQANSVLTAHLSSVVKVNTVQDELLENAGLKDFRQKVGDAALTIDKQIEEALGTAKDVDDAVSKLKAIFEKLNK